jgi:hypothetical protein
MKLFLKCLAPLLLLASWTAGAVNGVQVNGLPAAASANLTDLTVCDQSNITKTCTLSQVQAIIVPPQAPYTIYGNSTGSTAAPGALTALPTAGAVMALQPVSYDLKPEFNPEHLGNQVGLIAEDVAKVDPRLVAVDDKGDPRGVRYMQLTAVLVKTIQQQQYEIYALALWCLGLTGWAVYRRRA